jgi:hypothetical protein
MSLVSLDDSFFSHPKAVRAGEAAMGLHIRAIAYCSRFNLADGRFPRAALRILMRRRGAAGSSAQRLVNVGLWLEDGEDFIATHDPRWWIEANRGDELERAAAADRTRRSRDGTNRAVIARDDGRCVYCGCGVDLVVDHVLPFKRGGLSTLDNLVAACRSCNSSKRNQTPSEWRS